MNYQINKNQARRTDVFVQFAGADITESLKPDLLSLTYTDNEEDTADDLQIKIADRNDIWLTKWLINAVESAASNDPDSGQVYKVISPTGVEMRSAPGHQYQSRGSLPYGTAILVTSIENGWAEFTFAKMTRYVDVSFIAPAEDDYSDSTGTAKIKGLKIQAAIIQENWKGDGNDTILACGQFELDRINGSSPPNTITIKGTALPYDAQIRQTKKNKSWESYTLSGIGKEMADKNGMAFLFLSKSDPEYSRVEQVETSDIAFLALLCHSAGNSLKVSNNIIIIFDQKQYESKDAIKTITRGSGYSKVSYETGEAETKYGSCHVYYTDPITAEVIEASVYSPDAADDSQCLEVNAKVESIGEAMELAQKMLRLRNKYETTMTFTLPGDVTLLAGCTVEVKGFGYWDGKYIIKSAVHTVSKSGYTTQIKIRKVLEGI